MTVGQYDPDEDDKPQTSIKAKPAAKTTLQEAALSTCARKVFTGPKERNVFRALEDLCRGATDEEWLIEKWYRHCIEVWRKANTPVPTRPFNTLMKYMGNKISRDEWILQNKERLLKERAQGALGAFEEANKKNASVVKDF